MDAGHLLFAVHAALLCHEIERDEALLPGG